MRRPHVPAANIIIHGIGATGGGDLTTRTPSCETALRTLQFAMCTGIAFPYRLAIMVLHAIVLGISGPGCTRDAMLMPCYCLCMATNEAY